MLQQTYVHTYSYYVCQEVWSWYICYAQNWNLLNPRIALLIPKIPGLAGDPRNEHAQTWNLLNPRIVLLTPKIPELSGFRLAIYVDALEVATLTLEEWVYKLASTYLEMLEFDRGEGGGRGGGWAVESNIQ